MYNIKALYQKTGFLLARFREEMLLSPEFIEYCKSKVGKSTNYLLKEAKSGGVYNSEWKLVVPEDLFDIIGQGGGELV